jgi:hypothetical protein
MTVSTKRDIEFGLAVLIITAFVVTGIACMGWWLFCLLGGTLP